MGANTIRILLVEDDEHDRTAFERALKKGGIATDITTCQRAEEALERLQADAAAFDIAVIDHKLPGMSGMDLCKALIAEEVLLPLVILTGNGSEGLAVEALKAGIDDYVVKDAKAGYLDLLPLVLPEVVRNHRDRLAHRRAEEELHKAHEEVSAKAAALEQINVELAEYASAVSHDLKAPLRAIHNYTDFLAEDLAGSLAGEQKKYLDGLRQAVVLAETMVTDLLELYSIGAKPPQTELIDLGAFLRELTTSANLPPEVEIKMSGDWPAVEASPLMLRQVFQNLIDNAVKFNQSSRKLVELGWRELEGDRYQIFVRDNGIGIEPDHQKGIFGVFQRLHPAEDFGGTGIGLAIVKKAAARLGGSVQVESTLGQGSTFFLVLPKALRGESHEQ